MGWINDEHIIKFLKKRTIQDISFEGNLVFLHFSNGEKLRMYVHDRKILCTPFDRNDVVKQSTTIMKKGK